MRALTALLLLFASQLAHATPCITPDFISAANSVQPIGNVVHFFGGVSLIAGNCSIIGTSSGETTLEFGDGQTTQTGAAFHNLDHAYAGGTFLATVTQFATVDYLGPNLATCNQSVQTDCVWIPHTASRTFSRSFELTIASHMPEPSTGILMGAGFFLLALYTRTRRLYSSLCALRHALTRSRFFNFASSVR